MAIENNRLIFFLEKTVDLLRDTTHYEWGHSGACNCGHLAQVITGHKKADIHKWSLQKNGDWTDKADLYCETSGYEIDNVISSMISIGLQIEDIHHIEYLNHPRILERLSDGRRSLQRNLKEDVITYFQLWVELLKSDASSSVESWSSRHDINQGQVVIYDSVPDAELEAI